MCVGWTSAGVMPDTSTSKVDAWNAELGVSLVVVSKRETCAARLGDDEVDFLACTGPLDRPGGTSCGWATHELGGKDSKRRSVIKMDLPEKGSVFAIQVKPSGSSVVHLKVFLLPILCEDQLPYPHLIDWALPLTIFRFKAREWRFVIEGYKGSGWFAALWTGSTSSSQVGDRLSQ